MPPDTFRTLVALALPFCLLGCQKRYDSYLAIQQIVPPPTWQKVAILPFSGDRELSRVADDVFKKELLGKTSLTLVSQPPVEPPAEGTHLTLSEAQRLASAMQADAFIHGSISAEGSDQKGDAATTVDLVDVKSGRILASSHRPSGELIAENQEERVTTATERAAKDLVRAIKRLNIQSPPPVPPGKKK